MKNVRIDKVDNGYVLTIEKFDVLTRKPDGTVTVHTDLKSVLQYIEDNF